MYYIAIQDNLLSMGYTAPTMGKYQWFRSCLDQKGQIQEGYGPGIIFPKAGNIVRFYIDNIKVCNKSSADAIRRFCLGLMKGSWHDHHKDRWPTVRHCWTGYFLIHITTGCCNVRTARHVAFIQMDERCDSHSCEQSNEANGCDLFQHLFLTYAINKKSFNYFT